MKTKSFFVTLFGLFFFLENVNAQTAIFEIHEGNPESQIIDIGQNTHTDFQNIFMCRLSYIPEFTSLVNEFCEYSEVFNAPADLNQDGIVNVTDLMIFLSSYGTTYTTAISGCDPFSGNGEATIESLVFNLRQFEQNGCENYEVSTNNIFDEVLLFINGEEVASTEITPEEDEVTFLNLDYDFSYEDELIISIGLRINEQGGPLWMDSNYSEGTMISADLKSAVIETADGDVDVVIEGGMQGNNFHLFSQHLNLEYVSSNVELFEAGNETWGTFEITFSAEAVGGDASIQALVNNALSIEIANLLSPYESNSIVGLTSTISSPSGASEDECCFLVEEGDIEIFTITCTVDPVYTGSHQIAILEFPYSFGEFGYCYPKDLLYEFVTEAYNLISE
jgi:hypothetical protein